MQWEILWCLLYATLHLMETRLDLMFALRTSAKCVVASALLLGLRFMYSSKMFLLV